MNVTIFEDICTVSEIKAMAQRLEVAKMLRQGYTYIDIAKKTGASTATISRVNRCLVYGADGYRTILERLEKKNPGKPEREPGSVEGSHKEKTGEPE